MDPMGILGYRWRWRIRVLYMRKEHQPIRLINVHKTKKVQRVHSCSGLACCTYRSGIPSRMLEQCDKTNTAALFSSDLRTVHPVHPVQHVDRKSGVFRYARAHVKCLGCTFILPNLDSPVLARETCRTTQSLSKV
jgi:hypothetical protein